MTDESVVSLAPAQGVDAVILTVEGASLHERVIGGAGVASQYLRGKPYLRDIGGGRKLATTSPHDTLYYPTGHPKEGQDRYLWRDGPDGIQLGTLRPE